MYISFSRVLCLDSDLTYFFSFFFAQAHMNSNRVIIGQNFNFLFKEDANANTKN
jgi:hypothetical protein